MARGSEDGQTSSSPRLSSANKGQPQAVRYCRNQSAAHLQCRMFLRSHLTFDEAPKSCAGRKGRRPLPCSMPGSAFCHHQSCRWHDPRASVRTTHCTVRCALLMPAVLSHSTRIEQDPARREQDPVRGLVSDGCSCGPLQLTDGSHADTSRICRSRRRERTVGAATCLSLLLSERSDATPRPQCTSSSDGMAASARSG